MPSAALVGDVTTHGGTIVGPGSPTVIISGKPAALVGDTHVCAIPPNTPHLTVSNFPSGSTIVTISGKPALRTSDACLCGAMSAVGSPTVVIN